MQILIPIALVGWTPLVMAVFSSQPGHRAVLFSYILGWLYLPIGGFVLPGMPDYDKLGATSVSVLIGASIFDTVRLFRFRPKWFDVPMILWTTAPFWADMTNGLGAYTAFSDVEKSLTAFTIPYFMGRIYFDTPQSHRELTTAMVAGALSYIPFCLYELRFSPMISMKVYGVTGDWVGLRYGGWRPNVFMVNALETGFFIAISMMIGFQLRINRSVTTVAGMPLTACVVLIGLTAVAIKTAGAVMLGTSGVALLFLVRKTRSPLPIYVLMFFPVVYVVDRSSRLVDVGPVLDIVRTVLDGERARSLGFRFEMEDILAARAWERWLFGWGSYGRNLIFNEEGRQMTIADGFWIIAFGQYGLFGLSNLVAWFVLPTFLFLRKFPVTTWARPEVAPSAAMAMVVSLYLIDNLVNAMLVQTYFVMAGGLLSLNLSSVANAADLPRSPIDAHREMGDYLGSAGRPVEAAAAYRQAIALGQRVRREPATLRDLALAHSHLADLLETTGDLAAGEAERRAALALREMLASRRDGDPADWVAYAGSLDDLARTLTLRGDDVAALEARRALETALRAPARRSREDLNRWLTASNDLAWLLVDTVDPVLFNPREAVQLARRATAESPTSASFWNTLGVAHYRAGEDADALAAIDRSLRLGPPGGTAFDLLVRAMVLYRLGDLPAAVDHYARGIRWADEHAPDHAALRRLRDEARDLIAPDLASTS